MQDTIKVSGLVRPLTVCNLNLDNGSCLGDAKQASGQTSSAYSPSAQVTARTSSRILVLIGLGSATSTEGWEQEQLGRHSPLALEAQERLGQTECSAVCA
eukprot:2147893-Amphidinium_carterae.1